MRVLSQHCIHHRQTGKRTIAWVLFICLVAVSLLSGAFIPVHANHAHDHNGIDGACAACTQMQNAGNMLKQLGTTVNGGFVVWAGLYAAAAILNTIFSDIAVLTPVTSKLRMNN